MSDPKVASRDLSLLAPKFREAVEAAIADCASQGLPVKVAEAVRSQERQAYLYAQGRTRPGQKVTNAPSNLTSWHGYGLAVDAIHETKGWAPGANDRETTAWFRKVADTFKRHGCAAGIDWRSPDMPHMQWGNMPASPQASHKALKQSKGNAAVWEAVGASAPNSIQITGVTGVHIEGNTFVTATLRLGDKGPSVTALQQKLAQHGRSINLKVDGDFGQKTEDAVKAFQRVEGLTTNGKADGIVGSRTWEKLG